MKLILIAAALAASPALAQTANTPTDGSATTAQSPTGQTQSGLPDTGPKTNPTDPQAQSGSMPANGAMSPSTGQTPPPPQTDPAPAPLDHYPPCKPGQYDQCMQTGGSHKAAKGHAVVKHHTVAHRAMPAKT